MKIRDYILLASALPLPCDRVSCSCIAITKAELLEHQEPVLYLLLHA